MIAIDPKRSRFRKTTTTYTQDNLLDIIDIEEALMKNKFIHKIDSHLFLYDDNLHNDENKNENENSNSNASANDVNSSNNNRDKREIYKEINSNKFGIKIENLELVYQNGYTVNLVDKYKPIKLLGQGSFGFVISAWSISDGKKVAIKIIDKSKVQLDGTLLQNEIILKKLDHKRILQLHGIIDSPDYLFLFMELMEGGTLRDLILNRYALPGEFLFKDNECAAIIEGILEGLDYLHMNNIIHRDLKPENIMFKRQDDIASLTICDFGASTQTRSKERLECGTVLFMAPEMIEGKGYDTMVDMWACGIILFILASGGKHPLYRNKMSSEEFTAELLKRDPWSFPNDFPLLARNLFLKLCKFELDFRYSTSKALKHPWITRSPKSQIPLTLYETFGRIQKIQDFKSILSVTTFLAMFKGINAHMFIVKAKILLPNKSKFLDYVNPLSKLSIMKSPAKVTKLEIPKQVVKSNSRKESLPKIIINRDIEDISPVARHRIFFENEQTPTHVPTQTHALTQTPTQTQTLTLLNENFLSLCSSFQKRNDDKKKLGKSKSIRSDDSNTSKNSNSYKSPPSSFNRTFKTGDIKISPQTHLLSKSNGIIKLKTTEKSRSQKEEIEKSIATLQGLK